MPGDLERPSDEQLARFKEILDHPNPEEIVPEEAERDALKALVERFTEKDPQESKEG